MQSDQLTTDIPNHLSNSIATGQQDDYDYWDNREGDLYQVDGTTDIQTPDDNSDDNEDNEADNTAGKRQKKTYATANTIRKEMTRRCIKEVRRKIKSKSSSQNT